jgi:hypothetical protein
MSIKLAKPTRNRTSIISLRVPPEKVDDLRNKVKDIAVSLLSEELKNGTLKKGITVLDIVEVAVKHVGIDWFGDGENEDVEEDTIEVLITRRLPIEVYRKDVDAYYRRQHKEKEKLRQNKDRLIKSVDKEIETLNKKIIGAEKRKEKLQDL